MSFLHFYCMTKVSSRKLAETTCSSSVTNVAFVPGTHTHNHTVTIKNRKDTYTHTPTRTRTHTHYMPSAQEYVPLRHGMSDLCSKIAVYQFLKWRGTTGTLQSKEQPNGKWQKVLLLKRHNCKSIWSLHQVFVLSADFQQSYIQLTRG